MAARFSGFLRFGGSVDGNIAVLFALLLAPLLLAAGAGLDYARTAQARAVVQEAADAALLRVARLRTQNPSTTEAEMTALAREIFNAGARPLAALAVNGFNVDFDPATETFSLVMDGDLPTTLLGAVGYKSLSVSAHSEVSIGAPPYVEVVMALDNTGSMNDNGKIDSLKTSAGALVEALFANAASDIKVGLVPFAQYVNVGASNDGASWLGATPAGWLGCVGSRTYPSNAEDGGYGAQPIPAIAGDLCPAAITPMTNDKAAILGAIDAMKGAGWTYIADGVAWGWRALSSQAPFTEGLSAAEIKKRDGVKTLIVLTDGQNTRAPSYPLHDSADTASADTLTARLCQDAKKDGIVVYTIAFDVTDIGVRTLLEDCGTTPRHYFEAANAAELGAAFSKIAAGIRNLSLSR